MPRPSPIQNNLFVICPYVSICFICQFPEHFIFYRDRFLCDVSCDIELFCHGAAHVGPRGHRVAQAQVNVSRFAQDKLIQTKGNVSRLAQTQLAWSQVVLRLAQVNVSSAGLRIRIRIRFSNFSASGYGSGFQIFWIRIWIRFRPRFWKIAERSLKVIYQKKIYD